MSGGRRATRGFLVQSIQTLVAALQTDDWNVVILEPEEPSEKVDITWLLDETTLRKVQVKSSENPFDRADVVSWAAALVAAANGASCIVQLCGPLKGGAADLLKTGSGGVRIECISHDLDSLSAICRDAIHEAVHRVGRYGIGPDHLRDAIPRLAGVLFAEGVRSRPWSRNELWREVLRAVEPAPRQALKMPWCQNRIIHVEASGDSVETFIVSYHNSSRATVDVPGVITRLSDSINRAVHVFDGLPDLKGEADILNGTYTVYTPPRGSVPPGGWRHLGCVVHRRGMVQFGSDQLVYEDVFLPPDGGTADSRAWLIVPDRWRGGLIAPTADRLSESGCSWKLSLDLNSMPRLKATSTPTIGGGRTDPWVVVAEGVSRLARGGKAPDPDVVSAATGLDDLPAAALLHVAKLGAL